MPEKNDTKLFLYGVALYFAIWIAVNLHDIISHVAGRLILLK